MRVYGLRGLKISGVLVPPISRLWRPNHDASPKITPRQPSRQRFTRHASALCAIVWGFVQNDRRLHAMEKRIDSVEQRHGRIENGLDSVDVKLADLLVR